MQRQTSGCVQILVAVIGAAGAILAAVIGGPLLEDWLKDRDNNGGGPDKGGAIVVTASANPNIIGLGQLTEISVLALDDSGAPIAAANVTIQAGGGIFQATGTTTVSGKTDNAGIFRATWSCNPCAAQYDMEARATKANFADGQDQVSVFIQ